MPAPGWPPALEESSAHRAVAMRAARGRARLQGRPPGDQDRGERAPHGLAALDLRAMTLREQIAAALAEAEDSGITTYQEAADAILPIVEAAIQAEREALQRERDAFQECALKRAAWQEEAQRAVDDLKTENESLGRIIGEQQAEVERLRA